MSTETIIPRQTIEEIAAYVPGKSTAPGGVKQIKLSSNETPLGASPRAIEAFQHEAQHLERYPDGSANSLRHAIGAHYGLNPDHIVCGAGSDELLNLLAQAYLTNGDEAIYTEHGFLVYRIAILAAGAQPVVAPERNYTCDVDSILAAVTENTKMVFIANPNNPTGTYIPVDEVKRLRSSLPDHVLLVLDGAYAEYVSRNDYEAGIELVATTSNTVMTRTFSKIYGLACLRLGWAYCPANVAEVLNKIRGPFNVSGPAMAAGIAAIEDVAHKDAAISHNNKWLEQVKTELEALGLLVTPSVGNFLLIHFAANGPHSAQSADQFLLARGIIVRRMEAYGMPSCLRMTIGRGEENEAVIAALKDFLARGDQS